MGYFKDETCQVFFNWLLEIFFLKPHSCSQFHSIPAWRRTSTHHFPRTQVKTPKPSSLLTIILQWWMFVTNEQEILTECLRCINTHFHLTGKMTPQAGCSTAETLTQEDEHQIQRMMAKRAKIIKELIQTEKDYLNDLELCVQEVVQPLRNKQVNATLRVPPAPS